METGQHSDPDEHAVRRLVFYSAQGEQVRLQNLLTRPVLLVFLRHLT